MAQLWWTRLTEGVWGLSRQAQHFAPLTVNLSPPPSLFVTLLATVSFASPSAYSSRPWSSPFLLFDLFTIHHKLVWKKKKAVNCFDKGKTEGDTGIKGRLRFIFMITDRLLCSFNWTSSLSVVEGCVTECCPVYSLICGTTTELRKQTVPRWNDCLNCISL